MVEIDSGSVLLVGCAISLLGKMHLMQDVDVFEYFWWILNVFLYCIIGFIFSLSIILVIIAYSFFVIGMCDLKYGSFEIMF